MQRFKLIQCFLPNIFKAPEYIMEFVILQPKKYMA